MACVRKVEDLSTDPNFVGYYDIEKARQQEMEDMKETGLRIGIEQGMKQGSRESKIEIVKAMLNENLSLEMISKCTGLCIEEINNIIEN